ncbi:MAG TPA: Gfo/Idh/MocA family oxidoreductase [Pseudolysinimonas sp.]|nr:Gfo/Idh/MocA family oxidoreductase [Pseudolysinimonas sp.]
MRLIFVGFGMHGRRIATLAAERGHDVVAIVDPALAGRPVTGFASSDHARADVAELAPDLTADAAVVTAPVDLAGLEEIARELLARGLDVVTIHPDAFDPPREWRERLDSLAKQHGVRMLGTGVQDVWWVHVPAVAAASMARIDSVTITHHVDLDSLAVSVAQHLGAGLPESEFVRLRDEVLSLDAPVLGGPLRVLATRLGLTPGEIERDIRPVTRDVATVWRSADRTVEAGELVGFSETSIVHTLEGVKLRGTIVTALLDEGATTVDEVTISGDPELHLEHRPFPGGRITDVVPVARLEDIREAAPGFHTAAWLPPATYRHPADRPASRETERQK